MFRWEVKRRFFRGDSVYFPISVKDSSGNPVDITGATIYFTMKANLNDSDPGVIQKAVTEHVDPTQGLSQVVLSAAETDSINPGIYYYDFQIVFSNGDKATLEAGKIEVVTDITRQ